MTSTAAGPVLLDDASLHERVRDYVGARAQQVDGCEVALRDGIAHLASLGAGARGIDEAGSSWNVVCH